MDRPQVRTAVRENIMETRRIDGHTYDFTLDDDGTMDTVVEIFDHTTGQTVTWYYTDASEYRDVDGVLDLSRFVDAVLAVEAAAYAWGE